MLTRFFYNLGLHLFVLFSLPKVFYSMLTKGKYRKSFLPRLGRGFPHIEKGKLPLVWIHAVSLGETKAIIPLAKKLKSLENGPKVLLTSGTETGYAEGQKAFPEADYHYFLPLDLSYIVCPIVKKVAPDLLILTESDFWLNFQDQAKKEGASLLLVNGKISERSFGRLRKIPSLAKALHSPFDLFCLQGNLYRERFAKLGVPEKKMRVTGNIKFDSPMQKSVFERADLGLSSNDLVLTLGSTHAPEEKIFLDHFEKLQASYPHLKLLIVPRHPERFDAVSKILEKMHINYARYSLGEKLSEEKKVLLVDKMGSLRSCYELSDIAFVGGSFTSHVGGHNILEPSFYGVPVLFGPHMHSQPDFLDLMRAYGGGIQVSEASLLTTLQELLNDEKKRKEIGNLGRKLTEEAKGALDTTWKAVLSCLKLKE